MKITMGHDQDYETRDGRSVRILAVDMKHTVYGIRYPVVALVPVGELECVILFSEDGYSVSSQKNPHDFDIIERPRKFRRERWVNVYVQLEEFHATKDKADKYADRGRIACVKVVIEGVEGEGLESEKEGQA